MCLAQRKPGCLAHNLFMPAISSADEEEKHAFRQLAPRWGAPLCIHFMHLIKDALPEILLHFRAPRLDDDQILMHLYATVSRTRHSSDNQFVYNPCVQQTGGAPCIGRRQHALYHLPRGLCTWDDRAQGMRLHLCKHFLVFCIMAQENIPFWHPDRVNVALLCPLLLVGLVGRR